MSEMCRIHHSKDALLQGGNCDVDTDECASKPCANGATCIESNIDSGIPLKHYQCSCVDGFSNGACRYADIVEQYAQNCSKWLDGTCDMDVDECSSSPCQNGPSSYGSVSFIV